MKRTALIAAFLVASIPAFAQSAEQTVRVGGQAMFPSKTIVANAVNSADHTTLVTAVKAAGLVDTLNSKGPFTVFAPTNAAFGMLPAGTVETLVKPRSAPPDQARRDVSVRGRTSGDHGQAIRAVALRRSSGILSARPSGLSGLFCSSGVST